MLELQVYLYKASIQRASKDLSFRLKAPTFVPLKGERPQRPREYWPEKNFKWPDANKEDPRPAWTKEGWMDTSEEEDVWDDDAYYAHLDNLDFY